LVEDEEEERDGPGVFKVQVRRDSLALFLQASRSPELMPFVFGQSRCPEVVLLSHFSDSYRVMRIMAAREGGRDTHKQRSWVGSKVVCVCVSVSVSVKCDRILTVSRLNIPFSDLGRKNNKKKKNV